MIGLVDKILQPDGFPDTAPTPLSDSLFTKYAEIKRGAKKGLYLARDQEALLEQSLVSKVCHCIKSRFLIHKFQYEGLLKKPTGPNPYALCQSHVFNKEGLKGMNLRNGLCEKRFDWMRKLKDVNQKKIPEFPPYKPIYKNKKLK